MRRLLPLLLLAALPAWAQQKGDLQPLPAVPPPPPGMEAFDDASSRRSPSSNGNGNP
jgi:hypothetical protein